MQPLHYSAIFQPGIPETWWECFYTTLYLKLFLEHPLEEGGVLLVAVVPHPRPRGLQHVLEAIV